MKNLHILPLAAACLFCVAPFCKSQTVTVTSGPGPKQAKTQTTAYHAQCTDHQYVIDHSRTDKQLTFQVDAQPAIAITETDLGKSMNDQALYGRLALTCLPGALNVQFFGFDIAKGNPAPVEFQAIVSAEGKVDGGTTRATDQRKVSGNKMP